jgi:hypothetical protein
MDGYGLGNTSDQQSIKPMAPMRTQNYKIRFPGVCLEDGSRCHATDTVVLDVTSALFMICSSEETVSRACLIWSSPH